MNGQRCTEDEQGRNARIAYHQQKLRVDALLGQNRRPSCSRAELLDAITDCGHAYAAWEAARMGYGVSEDVIAPMHAKFWEWARCVVGLASCLPS